MDDQLGEGMVRHGHCRADVTLPSVRSFGQYTKEFERTERKRQRHSGQDQSMLTVQFGGVKEEGF